MVDFIISILFVCRAVYKTAKSDKEIRNVWKCAGWSVRTAAGQCVQACRDDAIFHFRSKGAVLTQRAKIIIAALGVSVSSVVLAVWAFVLGVACSTEACRGVSRLRDSAREGSAAVLFGAATVARAVGALGRDVVSRIRAAQLPVDN